MGFEQIKAYLKEDWDGVVRRSRVPWRILAAAASLVLLIFVVVLFRSHAGEVAGALGSFIGGIIGAGGAVWAVHLTVSRQRQEEIAKVSDAVRTEVTAFVKYVIGAVEVCQEIAKGTVKIPRQDARYIVKNFWGDPVVYPAVADRIGLLSHPHATTEFYMRLSEVKAMVEALRTKTDPQSFINVSAPPEYVTPDFASSIVDSLITALQLARPIVVGQIDECLKSAQASFPNAESFKVPQQHSGATAA